MKKLLAMTMALALMLCGLPALAELGAVDVTMEGEPYHLVLDSVDVANGKLTVVMEGFGDTLRMGSTGTMIAGIPEAQYGDEMVTFNTVNIVVGEPFSFIFERDSLPDAIWVQPYDAGQEAALLWQREGVTVVRPEEENAGQPTPEPTEAPTETSAGDSGGQSPTYTVPSVPSLSLPEVKVPDLPKARETATPKIEVPEIPKVEIPDVEVPQLTAADTSDTRQDAVDDAAGEASPANGEGEEKDEAVPTRAIGPDELLDALDEDVYRQTCAALQGGEVVEKGSKGDTARGVQQTLVAFGQDIAVDGNVGPKSIAALNAVQAAFGLEQTESLDAAGYTELLTRLLFIAKPGQAETLLKGQMDDGEYGYMQGCAYVAQGRYYSAKQAFEQSRWGDWSDRAAACAQEWPKTGQLYKNPDVKGSSTQLTVKFNGGADTAMLVKVYTTGDVLARTMFIGGDGKATCSLPAGTYIIKDGIGRTWYGEAEAFGPLPEGFYETMTFAGGERQVELKKNYSSTITVNAQEANPTGDKVGSSWENWGDF